MTEENQENRKLTVADPVDPETLQAIEALQSQRIQIADRLLDLKNEEVRLLRMAQGVDTEKARVFESINVARGLSPHFPLEIDAKTGNIKPLAPLPDATDAAAE